MRLAKLFPSVNVKLKPTLFTEQLKCIKHHLKYLVQIENWQGTLIANGNNNCSKHAFSQIIAITNGQISFAIVYIETRAQIHISKNNIRLVVLPRGSKQLYFSSRHQNWLFMNTIEYEYPIIWWTTTTKHVRTIMVQTVFINILLFQEMILKR